MNNDAVTASRLADQATQLALAINKLNLERHDIGFPEAGLSDAFVAAATAASTLARFVQAVGRHN